MTIRRVGFRVDSSVPIGTGHVMRCLALADAIASSMVECHFISREHPGHILGLIRRRGHAVAALPARTGVLRAGIRAGGAATQPYASWLGCEWEEDAEDCRAALGGLHFDWLVVDHYALDARWESALEGCRDRLLAIDDLANRPHACDLLLDQNLGRSAEDYSSLTPAGCKILTGPEYSLLRPEFARLRPQSLARRAPPKIEHVLISMGGTDQFNATTRILGAMSEGVLPAGCAITVVMGGTSPWVDAVRSQSAKMPGVRVQVDVGDMAALMASADLAIGSAGTTSWERCCLGLPGIAVVLAENQKPVAMALEAQGAALVVPSIDLIASALPVLLRGLGEDVASLSRMSASAARVTDGNGTQRLKEFLGV